MFPPPAVHLDAVTKVYGHAAAPVTAVSDVTLTVPAGQRVALLGRSGSGKSTLLHLLAGLDRPTRGRVEVAGRNLAAMTSNQLADYRQTAVGLVFQSFHLIPARTALENVELPLVFAGSSPRQRRILAREALEAVGLGERLTHRPAELSGGERQRVAIARALVNRPGLLLADEPTGNLDTGTAAGVMELLQEYLRGNKAALILVTHDEDLARRSADRILRLQDGRLLPE